MAAENKGHVPVNDSEDEILGVECLFPGWLNLLLVTAKLSGEIVTRPLIEHPSGLTVLAYDPQRRVACIVERLRVLREQGTPLAEAVAGVAEEESAEETARHECKEQAGIELRSVEAVGRVWMTPSITTERVHLFLGEYGPDDRVQEGGSAEGEVESFEVREEPLSRLWASAHGGKMTDAKLFMLLQALRIRRPNLFDY